MFKEKKKDIEKSLELFCLSSLKNLKELKQIYRILTKKCHPDRHPDNPVWSTKKMVELNKAYEILKAALKSGKSFYIRNVKNVNIKEIITIGDQIIRDSVILGWLKKYPKNKNGIALKNRLNETYLALSNYPNDVKNLKAREYYLLLFSTFLKVTECRVARPLPNAWNSTRFFKQLSHANKFLDSGIRDYYHYFENNRLKNMRNIPVSYLKDAKKIYGFLLSKTYDEPNKKLIEQKIELAGLFIKRLQDSELRDV